MGGIVLPARGRVGTPVLLVRIGRRRWAMLAAAILGTILPLMERLGPTWMKTWTPSAPSLGLALVIPPFNSISMFLGAMIGFGLTKAFPRWSERFLITMFAGIVAGESLTGAIDAILLVLKG